MVVRKTHMDIYVRFWELEMNTVTFEINNAVMRGCLEHSRRSVVPMQLCTAYQ
jgi:hypothetical protein